MTDQINTARDAAAAKGAQKLHRPDFSFHMMLTTLINRLDSAALSKTGVIRWGCPVPCFGDISSSHTATLGLNPSNREFMDHSGDELQGAGRRFHTLKSLGLTSWSDVDARHLYLITESCRSYFFRNSYDRWFRKLDHVLSSLNASYYGRRPRACHLDLIPYATVRKWTELSARQRSSLLNASADTLGLLLRDSPVRTLILNGKSVVEQFEEIAGVRLEKQSMRGWFLPRRSKPGVTGIAYRGVVEYLSGVRLSSKLLVLGFNHNLQSSFGVSRQVIQAIRHWISRTVSEAAR